MGTETRNLGWKLFWRKEK